MIRKHPVKRSVGALAFALFAGCSLHQPEVLIPVRVDNALPALNPPVVTPSRPLVTVDEDPLRRIDRMEWPGPNNSRLSSGAPGPDYWQQRVDYTIAATLDTTSRSLRGTVSIRYTNNSPDTLRFIWIQLDQNLYRPGSKGAALFASDSRWGVRGFRGGYDITGLQVNGRGIVGKIDDTMMRIDLDAPLSPPRRDDKHRHAVRIRDPGSRIRPHGTRQHAV